MINPVYGFVQWFVHIQVYENGEVIHQLREGVLKRDKVKDLAASITNMRLHAQYTSDSDASSDVETGARFFFQQNHFFLHLPAFTETKSYGCD